MFTLVEWLNYFAVYRNVLGMKFSKRKVPYLAVFLLITIIHAVCWRSAGDKWRDIIIILVSLVAFPIWAEGKRGNACALFPAVLLISSLVNILGSYALAAVLSIRHDVLCESIGLELLSECTGIIVFSVYGKLFSKKISEEISFSWRQVCAMFLGTICCFMLIAFAQGVWNDDDFIFTIKEEVLVASIFLAFIFIGLLVRQQIVKNKALNIQLENEKYRLYLQGQQEHIQLLLEDDERRRRLKHDLRAHMLALNTYAQKGELKNVQEYLQKMEESFCVEQAKRYTGILGVDAIINDIHKKATAESIDWSFEGTLKNTTEIAVFDWCVLFSNLLTNALEATRECNVEKRIEVKISNIQEKVVLIVRNTCSENVVGTERPQTIKQDKINHGLGLKNVEEIIKKRDGTSNYEALNGWFEVTVIM